MATALKLLPDYVFPPEPTEDNVERETLNRQTPIARAQEAAAALNTPLRFGWGRNRVGGLYLQPVMYGSDLLLPFIIGRGPIEAIDALELGNEALPAGVTSTTYLGASGQGIDSWLAAAWAAHGKTYQDTLAGIAWGVLRIPPGVDANLEGLTIEARMLKVYDPRDGSQTYGVPSSYKYSDNPALALADFLSNTVYGRGEVLDWSTVTTVANVCDELVGGVKRRTFGLMIDEVRDVGEVEDTLREYAGAWVVREGGTTYLVADAPASPVFTFTNAAGSANYLANSLELEHRKRKDTPTVVSVVWTDTSSKPWRTATHTEPPTAPALYREQVVQMPGIQDASFARRLALRRLNGYTAADLRVSLTATPEAIALRRGDVCNVTDADGLSAKPFRLIGHRPAGNGLWHETLAEYDAAVYSDAVATGPSNPDTSLPSPAAVPAISGLTLAEELYTLETGLTASRLRATWTSLASSFPFLARYAVVVRAGGQIVQTATVERDGTTFVTGAVKENTAYQIDVAGVSTVNALGAYASATATAQGKALIPGDVPELRGFEAGGVVFLYWTAAVDIDVTRYEIRYGTTGGSWASATLLDRVDTLTLQAHGVAAGTWRFYVKAIDSIGQYSANAKTLDLTVTLDASAFLLGTKVFDELGSPTLTAMTAYTARPDPLTYYVTDFADALGYGHANTNDAVGTFDDLASTPWPSPHSNGSSSGKSTYLTQSWDLGQMLSGNWSVTFAYTNIVGTATVYVETSPDNSTWTQYSGGAAKTTARYVRGRIETTGAMVVASGCYARLDAFPREENGTVTTSASAAATVTLNFKYTAAKSIQLTPKGTVSRQAVFDNVVLSLVSANTFDVYAFNSAGAQISCDVAWLFQGI